MYTYNYGPNSPFEILKFQVVQFWKHYLNFLLCTIQVEKFKYSLFKNYIHIAHIWSALFASIPLYFAAVTPKISPLWD